MNHIEAMKQALEIGQKILANVNLDNLDIVDDLVDSNASLRQAICEAEGRNIAEAETQEPHYAWPTITDYEKDVGFQVNEAFKMGWNMARTTNNFLNQLAGQSKPHTTSRRTHE